MMHTYKVSDGVWECESESSSKLYTVRTHEPYSCTCTIFAIRRNKSINKEPNIDVWCKHLQAVSDQHGLGIRPMKSNSYAQMLDSLKEVLVETTKDAPLNARPTPPLDDTVKALLADLKDLK